MIYTTRSNGTEHGSVMTNHKIVEFMLDVVLYTPDRNLSKTTILEPSVGLGAFLFPILERLFSSSQKFGFSFEEALSKVLSIDIDLRKVKYLRNEVEKFLKMKGVNNPLDYAQVIVQEQDFLLGEFSSFDIVIGNPPYVRHELIPDRKKQQYRSLYSTFRHRSDLYIAFFEKALSLIKENGKVNYICADRWMKNKYGEKLRELISNSYHVSLIVDIDSDEAFDEKVSAYPAITLIERVNKTGFLREKLVQIEDLTLIKESFLKKDNTQAFYSFVDQQKSEIYSLIEEQGFQIGIGVATGADSIFIRKNIDFGNIENEVLFPLVKSENIVDGKIQNADQVVLYSDHLFSHKLFPSNYYPKAEKYLETHKEKLLHRHIAKKKPENWYKTIDRIHPELMNKPKLFIPDIKKNGNSIVLDYGNYYPHHNIYYIVHNRDNILLLKVLGAFLLSDFVHHQMQNISVLMRGGHVRWQAQNLRKLQIPSLSTISENERNILAMLYQKRDIDMINTMINTILIQTKKGSTRNVKKHNSFQIPFDFCVHGNSSIMIPELNTMEIYI